MSAPIPLHSGCCAPACPDSPQTAVPGPSGENAFSLTTANFNQPAVGAQIAVSLSHDGWVVPGQTLFIQTGGYYSVVSVSGLMVTLTNTGNTGNAAPGTLIASGSKVSPGGIGGNVGNAYTTTSANFNQPAVGAQVSVQVVASGWAAVGQRVFVATGGYYTVFSIPDGTHLSLTNNGDPVNAAPAVVINSPQQVSPAGLRGPTGATGLSTLNAISPTTTKGDLIVDNGANNPLASDVRLAAGTDGQLLASDSSQPTGLGWKTVTPNTVTTDRDIAIWDGATGTPMALKDSKLLITTDGAIQSTPSGGNARGAKAVDLQVTRAAVGQVASGARSAVLGGENNTASGTDSAAVAGFGNTASASETFVGGGASNVASGSVSGVCAGNTNSATATGAFVGAGQFNQATALDATVVAGTLNVASGIQSTISGGAGNTASGANTGIPGGSDAAAYLLGQIAHASGDFASVGDAQASELLYRISTTDATANVEAFLDGAAVRAVIPLNNTWGFEIHVIGRSSAGVCAFWLVTGALQNIAGTVSLVAAVATSVLADGTGTTWGVAGSVVVSADNTNKSLKIAVTGAVATNIRWVAHARLVEVNF